MKLAGTGHGEGSLNCFTCLTIWVLLDSGMTPILGDVVGRRGLLLAGGSSMSCTSFSIDVGDDIPTGWWKSKY